jgi:SSS family solute:Na+ symporter
MTRPRRTGGGTMEAGLGAADWAVIAGYFVIVFGVAIVATLRNRGAVQGSGEGDGDAAGYFLAGRDTGWFVVGASLFASNIGSEHLVGLAGDGFSTGVPVAQFEILAALILMALGWIFVPFYVRSGVYTMPEFLEKRYSPAARSYVLTKISVTLIAGGVVFEAVLGIDFWTGAIVVVLATGAYTVFGGLRAVLYTDLLQMGILVGGSVIVTMLGLSKLGDGSVTAGWDAMAAAVPAEHLSLWRAADDPKFPWTGILFGAPILGVWYWCTDQFIVQRVLAARNVDQARRGALFGGALKLLPFFIFVVPGVVAFALADRQLITVAKADQALPSMIAQVLPVGLRGLVVAGLLAALMSSLSSVFNSASTLVTWDVYKKLKPEASDKELVWVGQLATGLLVVLALAWTPIMQGLGQLFVALQSIQAYVSPPIAAVFLLGLVFAGVGARGAIAALATGAVLGGLRLVLETSKTDAGLLTSMNFLHFAVALFVVCSLVLLIVSRAFGERAEGEAAELTFAGAPADAVAGEGAAWRRQDLVLTVLVGVGVGALWLIFA